MTHVALAVLIAAILHLLLVTTDHTLLTLLAASIATVALMVFGIPFMRAPQPSPGSSRITAALLFRESILPLGMALGTVTSGQVAPETATGVVRERLPIVVLILTFAVIAGGLGVSGFFRYITVRTLLLCGGSVARLTIGMFVVASALTYIARNDIVVLMMTNIVLELCRQAGIRDVRILAVAANSPSMGLLFGSPTNIVIAVDTGLDFLDYLKLMAVPTAVTGAASLTVIVAMSLSGSRRAERKA